MKKLLILNLLIFFQFAWTQKTKVLHLNRFEVSKLEKDIEETSGLQFFRGNLLTFNDSGNTSELFEIDKKTGKILKILKTNLDNKDWEALASDSTNLYIGDIGNNAGNRKDLKIYKLPIKCFTHLESTSRTISNSCQNTDTQVISFNYPEQKDFTPSNLNTDFDAEAMIYLEGKIHLFTKEWLSRNVSHYEIDPQHLELQKAQKKESIFTGFSVSDAAYFDKKLYLVGYTKNTVVYLMVFEETKPGVFFGGKSTKYELGSAFNVGQIEGIAVNETGVYLTSEAFKNPLSKFKQRFYFIPKEIID